ncbi:hypothetical protein ABEF95_009348 [Exophiala dermatitidis]
MSSTHEPSGDDPLRPSAKEASAVLKKSQRHWGALLACARAADSLPASCANIHSLLHETPALPGADVDVEEIVDSKKESLDLVGYSVWGLGSTKCDLSNETKSSRAVEVQIGTSEPQFCTLSTEATLQWTGFQGFRAQRKTGNYLCALVLGWSYVLSARLVELRRMSGNDRITYTEAQAPLITGEQPFSEGDGVAISVGKADPGACRWWAAVLAGGCGWKAVLHRSGHDFHAPWACHLKFNNDEQIKFYHSPSTDSSSFATAKPPSSTQALQHLMDFAKLHDVVDQLLAAFAGALTLPPRQRYGAPVVLPQLVAALPKKETIRVTLARLLPSASDLPHFMAFSCVSMAVFSCLGSSLWQPGIACNLVSEWLYPIWQQALPELRREKRSDIIVRMMAMRRPSVAPLWLGSAITGSLPIFLDYHNGYGGPILLETVEWAKAPQSFMDPGYHRKAPVKVEKGQKYICREDEMRLLYISNRQSSQYQHLPLVPFPPIGSSRIKSTAIEVQKHAFCGHTFAYQYWVWQGYHERSTRDYGLSRKPNIMLPISACHVMISLSILSSRLKVWWRVCKFVGRQTQEPTSCDERFSEHATCNILSYILIDGIKPEDSELWKHEWVEGMVEDWFRDGDSNEASLSSGTTSLVNREHHSAKEQSTTV